MNKPSRTTPRLVSCAWLAEHLDDPSVRVIEVSASPDDGVYHEGHIPGALWWFWKDALWHQTDREFATPKELAQRLGSIGISSDTTIVLYGNPVQFGTYAFWVLTLCGHRDVRMLDGARTRWVDEGRPLSSDAPLFPAVEYLPGTVDQSSRMGRDNVRANLGQSGRLLLDVRSPEEYSGERVSPSSLFGVDHGAERSGRIPGAIPLHFRELVNEDDTFLSPDELRSKFVNAGAIAESSEEVVIYCRLSHRATLAWFAMEYILGLDNVRIYDGSWTEWGSIVGFPIEK
jgi:thiosulfate/3-mercaptopyruvate sulfurtransferase